MSGLKHDDAQARKLQAESGAAAQQEVKPIIVKARPGLSDVDSALVRRVPVSYEGKTIRDLLAYLVSTEVKDGEASTMQSLKSELGAAGSYIAIKGKSDREVREAKLTDRVDKYLVEEEKEVGDRKIKFRQLELEVSAVQQGGYRL